MTTPLSERLAALGLHSTSQALEDLIARATKARWGPSELLEHVADEELRERSRRSLEQRLSRSKLGRFKPMADYDWGWPKKIDREAVESALRLDFLEGARNIVIVAPPEPIAPTTMAGRQRAVPTTRQTEPAQASRQTFWQAHVQAWRISGLPRAAYCQQQNLSPRAFNAAVARLRQTFRPDPKTASKSA